MKRTSAEDAIIHALCPGPGEDRAFGALLVTYASKSATRVARSGAAEAAVGASAPVCARAGAPVQTTATQTMRLTSARPAVPARVLRRNLMVGPPSWFGSALSLRSSLR